jgi:hypothetical protein
MITKETVRELKEVSSTKVLAVSCDRCHKNLDTRSASSDVIELNTIHYIEFFDKGGQRMQTELCEECFEELMRPFCRVAQPDKT